MGKALILGLALLALSACGDKPPVERARPVEVVTNTVEVPTYLPCLQPGDIRTAPRPLSETPRPALLAAREALLAAKVAEWKAWGEWAVPMIAFCATAPAGGGK
jgi:predicted small lipoprotein YifL